MRKLPPLGTLRAFEAAARHLSFKSAADELGVTPTAISHQILQLEEFCGRALSAGCIEFPRAVPRHVLAGVQPHAAGGRAGSLCRRSSAAHVDPHVLAAVGTISANVAVLAAGSPRPQPRDAGSDRQGCLEL